ncbi:MAG TPA: ACT domain-containing protein [Myxococcaceae bacterium]
MAVCRLPPEAPAPAWAGGELTSITRTASELSVVAEVGAVPEGVRSVGPFRALAVEGTLDFALVGVLLALLTPLAAAGVSVFALSTFDTDLVLVRETDLERSVAALRASGHEVGHGTLAPQQVV